MNPHRYYRRKRGKRRGHFVICKYCFNSAVRNQAFCHECVQRSSEENKRHLAIAIAYATLSGFLLQKNISRNNLKTIKGFCEHDDASLSEYATLLLAIGQRFPQKKKRYKKIRLGDPVLFQRIQKCEEFNWLADETGEPHWSREPIADSHFEIENSAFDEAWLDSVQPAIGD